MKLCVLGDWHYQDHLQADFASVIADINAWRPEAVLSVGDLTGGAPAQRRALLPRAKTLLDRLEAPWLTVVGNHDLELSDCADDAANLRMFQAEVGLETPWFTRRLGDWLAVFLSTERFHGNSVQPHEVYLSPAQLAWFERTLAEQPNTPTLVVCHAPVLGCGLPVVPELHVRVGNAYVNQNHAPGALMDILLRHPQVLLWFCGHSHLGQHHAASVSVVRGLHFVHCGTAHPDLARDGLRHTRLVEFEPDGWSLGTLDHSRRAVDARLERFVPGGAVAWLKYRARL